MLCMGMFWKPWTHHATAQADADGSDWLASAGCRVSESPLSVRQSASCFAQPDSAELFSSSLSAAVRSASDRELGNVQLDAASTTSAGRPDDRYLRHEHANKLTRSFFSKKYLVKFTLLSLKFTRYAQIKLNQRGWMGDPVSDEWDGFLEVF